MNVINGNCLDVLKKMGDNSFDYGFTSPPYNILRNDKYQEYVDKIDDYYLFLCNFTDELLRTSQNGIFAAGDVRTTPFRQVVTAASDGALAAHMAEKYISRT